MSTKFTKIFNRLDLRLQIKILKELYKTGTLSPETLREIGSKSGQLLLNELHMIIVETLLNGVEPGIERTIMETLEKEEPEFAEDAKKAMFTFSDIANNDLRGLDQEYIAMNNLIEVLSQMELNGEIIIERFE